MLGVFSAALSADTLYRAISVTTAQRVEHARELVTDEVARLASGAGDSPEAGSVIGMLGGVARSAPAIAAAAPADWAAPLTAIAARASSVRRPEDLHASLASGELVARIAPLADGRLAWAAFAVRPPARLRSWKLLVVALTISSLLLIGATVSALVVLNRDTSALQKGLAALATDLTTTLPRSSVRELGDIADGISVLARHLAEARQQHERLERDLARQERLAALGRVTAGVAHEVRNPLASIKLRLDLAASQPAISPSIHDAIVHASSEISRLDQLVADLLIVSGRSLGIRCPRDVGALLKSRVEALAPWASLHGVSVEASGRGMVSVDADALARALDNLLRNAVEAAPGETTVQAAVSADAQQVRVQVRDPGPGVSIERVPELFEPFFTTKPEGTGLGLAISRAIARAHDGDLTYARQGNLTCFELTLPRIADQEEGASA